MKLAGTPNIAAATANIANLLVPQIPMELLQVRRSEKERAVVETVGVGLGHGGKTTHMGHKHETTATAVRVMRPMMSQLGR